MTDGLARIEIDSRQALWDWLSHNHSSDESYLLVTWKKANKAKYLSRDEVLDALLAYGWIDGRRYALDDAQTMQLICKRKQQAWTSSYRERIAKLEDAGLLKPSGRAAVETAKSTGNWLANQDIDALVSPADLLHALEEEAGLDWWQEAAPSYKRNCLRWLKAAKTTQTRQKRIMAIAKACGGGQKLKNM